MPAVQVRRALKLGADAGALIEMGVGGCAVTRSVILPVFVLMQAPTDRRQAPRQLVRELLIRGARFRQSYGVNWVEAAARGREALVCVLLADADASGDAGEPNAGGHPDERVLDAADVRAPREMYVDNAVTTARSCTRTYWSGCFEGEVDVSPRRLARYIWMLIDGYGFALRGDAAALATREGVREVLGLLHWGGLNKPAEVGVRGVRGGCSRQFAPTATIGFREP